MSLLKHWVELELPQCSQCQRVQEPQELKEAYQLPVSSDVVSNIIR